MKKLFTFISFLTFLISHSQILKISNKILDTNNCVSQFNVKINLQENDERTYYLNLNDRPGKIPLTLDNNGQTVTTITNISKDITMYTYDRCCR